MITPPFRCPHCGHKPGSAGNTHLYGSPFRRCDKCKQEYIDRRYHEIAIDGVRHEDINLTPKRYASDKKNAIGTIIAGIGFIVLHYIIAVNSPNFFFSYLSLLGAVLIAAGVNTLMDGTKRAIEKKRVLLDQERQDSIQRMQDPSYVQRLRSIGYLLKCPNCNIELDSYQNYCTGCGHTITPVNEVISLAPSRIKPAVRRIIVVMLCVAIIGFVTINSYNIYNNSGKYTISEDRMNYRGVLSSLKSEHRSDLRDFIYFGVFDDEDIYVIECNDYTLTRDNGLADIYVDNTTVYKEGLVQEYVRFDRPYDRFVDTVFCITDEDTGHKYHFCSYSDVWDWLNGKR